MILILTLIDWLLFIPLALCVAYLLVYAIASKFYRAPLYPEANKQHRIAVFFPAYKEDKVIIDSVRSFLGQDYPKELYDVYVISDHMQDSTNETLSQLPIRLLTATYEDSSKAKALLLAINAIEEEGKAGGLRDRQLALMYDIAVVMDADNVTVPGFLSEVNRAYCTGVWSMQAHRTGKNLEYGHRPARRGERGDQQRILQKRAQRPRTICRAGRFGNGFSLLLVLQRRARTGDCRRRQRAGACAPRVRDTHCLSGTPARLRRENAEKREHQEATPTLDGSAIRHFVRGTVLH